MRATLGGAVLLLAGCAQAPVATCPDAPYQDPGPYSVGVTRLDAGGVAIEVWYPAQVGAAAARDVYDMRDWLPEEMRTQIPADAPTRFESDAVRDAPALESAADGEAFPLVFFSHGLGGYRMQSTFLMTHLASHGFVVAAPEHAERNLEAILAERTLADDAFAQILAARALLERGDTPLAGRVDFARVAVIGHSAGGGAVQVLVDDGGLGVDAWVGMSTIATPESAVPGLVIGGTNDRIARRETVGRTYDDLAHGEKRYVQIEGAGHLAFSDICVIGRERGGVLRIAQDAGIEISELVITLATDGCREEDLPAEEAWPVIRHYVTAHLRDALEMDEEPTGLAAASTGCFDARVAEYRSAE